MSRPLRVHITVLLLAIFFLVLAGHARGAPVKSIRRTFITRRQAPQNNGGAFLQPESAMTTKTTDTYVSSFF